MWGYANGIILSPDPKLPLSAGGQCVSEQSNNRPLSLICISSKLLEHAIVSYVMNHLQDNNINY